VRAYERRGESERLLFVLNYTDQPQTVTLPGSGLDALTDQPASRIEVTPVDLRVVSMR